MLFSANMYNTYLLYILPAYIHLFNACIKHCGNRCITYIFHISTVYCSNKHTIHLCNASNMHFGNRSTTYIFHIPQYISPMNVPNVHYIHHAFWQQLYHIIITYISSLFFPYSAFHQHHHFVDSSSTKVVLMLPPCLNWVMCFELNLFNFS